MPRFVILEHDHPHRHWDLMLETGGVLRTWRLAEPPTPRKTVTAEAIGDHRLAYLDYEGPVSGNRGTVKRWDWGTFQDGFPEEGSTGTELMLLLSGEHLKGQCVLSHREGQEWLFQVKPLSQ